MSYSEKEQLDQLIYILQKPSEFRRTSDLDLIEQMTKNIEFFQKIEAEVQSTKLHRECCKYMEHEYYQKDQIIKFLLIDTIGEKFYIVLKGSIGVFIRIQPKVESSKTDILVKKFIARKKTITVEPSLTQVKILISGDSFGELALLNNRPRLATIISLDSTHLVVLRKTYFNSILKKIEEHKMLREMGFFAQLPLFKNWSLNLIRFIYLNSNNFTYTFNQTVFEEGVQVGFIYIIKSGQFEINKKIENKATNFDLYNTDILNLNGVLRQKMNSQVTKNVASLSFPSLIGIESLHHKVYQFSCKCVSSEGQLIGITIKNFQAKIYQHSKKYVDNQIKQLDEFYTQRVDRSQKEVRSSFERIRMKFSSNRSRIKTENNNVSDKPHSQLRNQTESHSKTPDQFSNSKTHRTSTRNQYMVLNSSEGNIINQVLIQGYRLKKQFQKQKRQKSQETGCTSGRIHSQNSKLIEEKIRFQEKDSAKKRQLSHYSTRQLQISINLKNKAI